jgi:catechol 2,3-dioxygenase-like lactoylglutathione lyase family enzyme
MTRSALVDDLHHLTFVTADLDRLIAFYERVFDARVTLDREDGGRRHAFIEIGPRTVLHPFEVPAADVPGRQPIFERGFSFYDPDGGWHEVMWVTGVQRNGS